MGYIYIYIVEPTWMSFLAAVSCRSMYLEVKRSERWILRGM